MTKFDWNQFEVERRVYDKNQKEIAEELKKIDERSAYKEREAKELVKDIAGKIIGKDEKRKAITKELQQTTDKDLKIKLLETHHQLTGEIEQFWRDKTKKWGEGLANIEKDKK